MSETPEFSDNIDDSGLQFALRPLTPDDREWVRRVLNHRWHGTRIISNGRVHQADALPGFVAEAGGERLGLVTYAPGGAACEIVSLDSMLESRGIGSALLDAVVDATRQSGGRRVWLNTTNDNLHALRFYQKRGFVLAALHRASVDDARRLKPSIPRTGRDGIPLRDEIELERVLDA